MTINHQIILWLLMVQPVELRVVILKHLLVESHDLEDMNELQDYLKIIYQ